MALLVSHRIAAGQRLTLCPTCGHDDLTRRPFAVLSVVRRPRTCAYFVGDEISPLRCEPCGCDNPLHDGRGLS